MTGSLLVIAPHPDDEILGAGAIMATARDRGDAVAVIVVTDGSRSDPEADPRSLAQRRRAECEAGLIVLLGALPPLLFLDKPDGGFDSTTPDLGAEALASFLALAQPDTLLVTDPADGHPDHKAAFGFATRLISAGWGTRLAVMPIGQRVDRTFTAAAAYSAYPVGAYAKRKAAAIACHASQLEDAPGFSLPGKGLAEFAAQEFVRITFDRDKASNDAIGVAHFDTMFDRSPDPWRYDDEPYERDRFRRTVAALADRRYSYALELGCANGALTEQLAPLCNRLLATDASRSALGAAQKRVGPLENVTLQLASLPEQFPPGPFDLIVASDLLYYLGLEGVVAAMRRFERAATADCRILIASYLGETDTPLTGEMASEAAIAHLPGWRRRHAERTDRLRIDVLERSRG